MAGRLSARMGRGGAGLLALLVTACAPTVSESEHTPPEPDATATHASREFQRDYDRALRDDPASFLTTIAAHYLAPGDALDTSIANVRLEAADASLTVVHGDAREVFHDHAELALDDRYALTISRQELDWRVLVHDRDAPARAQFSGVDWFPVDAALVVEARYRARATREPMLLQTSRGLSKTLHVAGEAELELGGQAVVLLVFAYAPEPSPGEPVLIPFRDASSGHQTYAAGRYLELELPTDGVVTLDFNRATNPLCAYSEHYNCPMPPPFNQIPTAILAGAKAPGPAH